MKAVSNHYYYSLAISGNIFESYVIINIAMATELWQPDFSKFAYFFKKMISF